MEKSLEPGRIAASGLDYKTVAGRLARYAGQSAAAQDAAFAGRATGSSRSGRLCKAPLPSSAPDVDRRWVLRAAGPLPAL